MRRRVYLSTIARAPVNDGEDDMAELLGDNGMDEEVVCPWFL
jgi:hypothetical protein